MTFLQTLLNPPNPHANKDDQYLYNNSTYDVLNALQFISNPSILTNANFATLGLPGQTPVTQADGDGAEISSTWHVQGATEATYSITQTSYAADSSFQSNSPYYTRVIASAYSGAGFYLYQKQINTVRWYQKNDITFSLIISNNLTTRTTIRMSAYSFYNPSDYLVQSHAIYLEPGLNKVSSSILTQSLNGIAVGALPYTEFRLEFVDFAGGSCDLNIYQIKGEFGTLSTFLSQ